MIYDILILTFPYLYDLHNFVQLLYSKYSQKISRLIRGSSRAEGGTITYSNLREKTLMATQSGVGESPVHYPFL